MPQCNERIPCWLRPRAGRWQSTQAGISDKKVAMLVTMLRVLVRFALMQLLPMLWFRSQASLAARTMTGARSHRRNWGIRCRLRSLAMLGLLAGVLTLVLLVRLLLLALPVLRCCRMAG